MSDKDDNKHPLSETLGISENGEFDDKVFKLDLPENATQEDIARIALEAYKDIMSDTIHMSPKYRARTLEVANMFLKTAQDAVTKKEDTRIKDGKLNLDKEKIGNKNKNPEGDGASTRKAVLQEVTRLTKKSNEA